MAEVGCNLSAESMRGIVDLVYPVGSYYWSSNATSPSTLFGGTWEQVKDRFVLAAVNAGTGSTNAPTSQEDGTVKTSWVGGSQPHNNMPPYITAYCWHRTA